MFSCFLIYGYRKAHLFIPGNTKPPTGKHKVAYGEARKVIPGNTLVSEDFLAGLLKSENALLFDDFIPGDTALATFSLERFLPGSTHALAVLHSEFRPGSTSKSASKSVHIRVSRSYFLPGSTHKGKRLGVFAYRETHSCLEGRSAITTMGEKQSFGHCVSGGWPIFLPGSTQEFALERVCFCYEARANVSDSLKGHRPALALLLCLPRCHS